jgi:lipopolysaccharide assembly outer membrane protein LptD (OstA)
MRYTIPFFLLIAGLFVSVHICGASLAAEKDKAAAGKKKPDEIHMTAEKLTYDEKKKIARLINNVRVTYGDTIMTSQKAEFDGVAKIGHFTGGVKLWQPGNVLTGDRMDAYYAEKRGVLSGHVRAIMEQRGGKAVKTASPTKAQDEGPVLMTCEEIEFFWEAREGVAKRNVKMWRKEKTAYADTVHYSQNSDLVTMEGNVRFERSKNDWLVCPEAYFDLKTETFVARGGVEGNVALQKEKEKKGKELPGDDRIIAPSLDTIEEDVFIKEIPPEFQRQREERIEKSGKGRN